MNLLTKEKQTHRDHTREKSWGRGIDGKLAISWVVLRAQACPTLCDPRNCSLPGSSVHGILQSRILEWVAMPSSRGSF